jgi:predicted phosphodiesterase
MAQGTRIDDAARTSVAAALARHGGNVAAAARETGLAWHTVNRYAATQDPSGNAKDFAPESIDAMVARLVDERIARMAGDRAVAVAPEQSADLPEHAPAFDPAWATMDPKSRIVRPKRLYERVAVVTDPHFPFVDRAAWGVSFQAIRDYKPDLVVMAGDLYDFYSVSRFDQTPERADAIQDEIDGAKPYVAEMDDGPWDVALIEGNHDARLAGLIRENRGLHRLRALQLKNAAELPARWHCYPNQTRIRIGSLSILHGDLKGFRGGKHVASNLYDRLKVSCLAGHVHRVQQHVDRTDDGTYRAGFTMGCLCDIDEVSREYYSGAPWANSFTTVDFNHSDELFAVETHLIVNGKAIFRGKTYRA